MGQPAELAEDRQRDRDWAEWLKQRQADQDEKAFRREYQVEPSMGGDKCREIQ